MRCGYDRKKNLPLKRVVFSGGMWCPPAHWEVGVSQRLRCGPREDKANVASPVSIKCARQSPAALLLKGINATGLGPYIIRLYANTSASPLTFTHPCLSASLLRRLPCLPSCQSPLRPSLSPRVPSDDGSGRPDSELGLARVVPATSSTFFCEKKGGFCFASIGLHQCLLPWT